ncbi:MAG: S-layer protein domain-containing protein [Methanolobus sp.]|nr:S-layer protein domain-containing protein [Methanolobus sp.]
MFKKFKLILIALSLIFLFSSVVSAANVTANFTANTTSGDAPLTVQFTDASINATEWYWDFNNDGTNDSTSQNAVYIYNSPGTYTVVLTAVNGTQSDVETKTNFITVNSVPPVMTPTADFTANTTSGDAPFTVQFTDASTNVTKWYWDFNNDGTNDSTSQNPVYTYNSPGNYTVSLIAVNGTLSDVETKTDFITVNSVPLVMTPTADFTANITSGDAPLTVQFTDASTNVTEWYWDFNNDGTNDSTSQNPVYTYNSPGNYTVSLIAVNGTLSDVETKTDFITVTIPSPTPPVASFTTNVTEGPVSLTVQFNDTSTNSPTSWAWDFNNDGTVDSTSQNPVHTFTSTGTYNVTLTASNADGPDSASKTITVRSKTYLTGDRIWDENADQSYKYTWNAKSFSGFFYDLDSGFSSETMEITIPSSGSTIANRDLVYTTRPVESGFEHSGWGKYDVIGFMAEKYFAGYTATTSIAGVSPASLISSGILTKVLLDDDSRQSVFSGSSLILEDGYRLNIVEIDVNGNNVFITLTKGGNELDSDVISANTPYIFEKELGSEEVPIIIVNFDSIFRGTETNAVFIQGIFQISEDYVELEGGEKYGKMEVTGFDSTYIEMKNDGSFSLTKGRTVPIMGKINFIVADSNDLRFAPFVDMSEPGTYELRGTVVEGNDEFTWTPLNFEGFYYDIDEGIQTEKLELKSISGRTINDLVYTSNPEEVLFERSGWGRYDVIGFMAEKYFAGYTTNTSNSITGGSPVSLIATGKLSKVLIDEDDKKSVYSGSSLVLEEGYRLNIVEVDVNGNNVWVTLAKDGKEVDSDIVSGSGTYGYEEELGSDKVPIIAIHFDSIFRGTETNAVFIQGIFQISEDYIELESGDTFGRMEVKTFDSNAIVMENKDSITLTRDRSISLMGDINIKVADDSNTVRYYPYVSVTTAPSQSLSVKIDNSVVIRGEEVIVTVTSRGASVSDATVKIGSNTIGKTDDEGRVTYTASTVGTYTVTAEKDNFVSGSTSLEVISPDDETKKMSIEVSPSEVYEGTSMTIFVIKAIGGDGISGAEVTYNGKIIGTTGSEGTVTYTATEAGVHKLKATRSGMVDAELDLRVNELAAKFTFTDLEISPLEIRQGKEATITVDVTNTGTADGEYTVDLKINDVVVDSQLVSLAMEESTTIEFKHKEQEPGTYKVEVGGLSTTYEVFERSGTVWYVLGAIALAAVGGIAYLFTAGGWTVEIAQAKVAEAIEAIKELVGNLR